MLEFQTSGVVTDGKVNILEKPKKKVTEKREVLRKTSFRPNRYFYIVVTLKLSTKNT
ncbi:Uncharacterized protein FWK35_00024097, partial [Aphis craccivora]